MRNKLTIQEIEEIKNNESVILSTSNNNIPRAIVVIPSRVEPERIILSNIQMDKTIENINNNSNCFINVYIKDLNDKQFKIDCNAEVYRDGELFDEIKEYEETNNLPEDLKVHSIIVAYIKSIEVCEG
jgi:predicted pyridoxine 5'-phosphate oxidase superfamily flavin-nucleotide-binding protein